MVCKVGGHPLAIAWVAKHPASLCAGAASRNTGTLSSQTAIPKETM